AVHAVGFWLSFGAVALLMLVGRQQQHLPAWRQGVQLQLALSALLLPLTLGFFERASWVSPFANLLAVPLVTFVVVPLGLLGLLLWPVAPEAADTLWQLAMHVLTALDALLAEFQQWPAASVDWSLPGRAGVFWAVLAVFCLCQPVAPRLRLLAPFFLLPLLLLHQPPAPGQLRVTVLDVGQGLAVLVEAGRYRLLYDTGPAFGDSDAGRRIVLPALRQAGVGALDHLLLSHDDLDHTGGAASILDGLPVHEGIGAPPSRYAGAPLPPWRACDAGIFWMRAGWRFEVVHPDAGAQAAFTRDNDRSCVLRVSRGGRALLLPGDLERHSEAWLLTNMPAAGLRSDVLVLGHHGSRQASSAAFLEQVAPTLAIASAGYRNSYGHPAVVVRERLTAQGIPLLNTADSGALRFELGPAGVTGLSQWRVADRRYWRHPPPDLP
ncbi:MAG: DNA internalization-related competence protein ComEC/Rec2, partial [Moraxellaceae bacterium]|nr:DNA internalization-related competence protein ComEC/Rec2 [Moraxellaceae bacterium]